MRLWRPWRLEQLRRLTRLAPELHATGLPRRPRLAGLALRSTHADPSEWVAGRLVLLDANANKLEHAEREFSEPCAQLNVLQAPLQLSARFGLLLSLLLPGRLGDVTACVILVSNLRQTLPSGSRIALYNPYLLLQYAAAELIEVDKVFHLAPEYPRVANAREVFACTAAHEILGYRSEVQRVTIQPLTIVDDRPVIRVYLTQILGLVERREEAELIDFVRWVQPLVDVPVEIFLHYLDREIDENDPRASLLFGEFGSLIRRDPSLHSLSSAQVSVSGSSSIGYDLLSSDLCHLMIFDPDYHEVPTGGTVWPELSAWRERRCDVVRFDAPYREWLDALSASDSASFYKVFGRSPGEVTGHASVQS